MDMANGDGEPSLGLSKITNPNKSHFKFIQFQW